VLPKEFTKQRKLRSSLLWDITKRTMVIPYRRFGTSYRSPIQGSRSPRRKSI